MSEQISFINKTGPMAFTVSGATYMLRDDLNELGGQWIGGLAKHWAFSFTDTTQADETLAKVQALIDRQAAGEFQQEKRGRGRPRKYPEDDSATPQETRSHEFAKPANGAPDLAAALAAFVAQLAPQGNATVDRDQVLDIVAGAMNPLEVRMSEILTLLQGRKPEVLRIESNGEAREIKGLRHEKLPALIRYLSAGLHVWLAGPSGSGKTHGAKQAAEAMGLTFRLQGAMTMAHELTGFVDAGGKYHETPFVTSFRNGGLILLDELDAGSNEALLALNAALANGVMCLPSGEIIEAHKDFRCVGAANTYGHGATHEYVGRTRIDAAFLQRFGAAIDWGYDEALERAMAANDAWVDRVQAARAAAKRVGLKVLITPRASIAGAIAIAAGDTPEQAAEATYLRGLSPEQRRQLGA